MVTVETLRVRVDAWSLVSGPPRVEEVTIGAVEVRLEVDPDHGPNWIFDMPPGASDTGDGGGPSKGIVLDQVRVTDLTVHQRTTTGDRQLVIDELAAHTDEDGDLVLGLDGTLDGAALQLSGSVGPLVHLWTDGEIEAELSASLADHVVEISGSVADVAMLSSPRLTVEWSGRDVEDLARLLGLPSPGEQEPYRLEASTKPASTGVEIDLLVDFGRFDGTLSGTVDKLVPPSAVDAQISAAGPDLARLGAWVGIDKLPAEPFTVEGRVRYADEVVTLAPLHATVGPAVLAATGHVGVSPALLGTEIEFELSGPDLATYAAIAGRPLPSGPFAGSGRVKRVEEGLALDGLRLSIADHRIAADGLLTLVPLLVGSDLELQAEGPAAGAIGEWIGVVLPDESYSLAGRVRRETDATMLDAVRVQIGAIDVHGDGRLGDPPALAGTDLQLNGKGPDLGVIARIAGIALPAGAFEVNGRLTRLAEGYGLGDVDARLGESTARVDGVIGKSIAFTGQAAGPDLAALLEQILADLVDDIPRFPAAPFDVDGSFEMDSAGYRVEGLKASVGDVSFELTGRSGREPAFAGLQATLSARADSLDLLGEYVALPPLPGGVVEVAGGVSSDSGGYVLHGVRGRLGANRFSVDGALGRLAFPFDGLDAAIEAAGPDLAAFEILEPGLDLPAEPFRIGGRVHADAAGYRLTDVNASVGQARATLDGQLGPVPDLVGSDLVVDISAVPLVWFDDVVGRELPDELAGIQGRIGRGEHGFAFDKVNVTLGDHRIALDGILDRAVPRGRTRLSVELSGPDLAVWSAALPDRRLPAGAYDLRAKLAGNTQAFSIQGLSARLGDSDLSGELSVDLRNKPLFTGALVSHKLDLATMFAGPETDTPATEERARLLAETPFELDALGQFDADLLLTIEDFVGASRGWGGMEIAFKVEDGGVAFDPITVRGESGSTFTGAISMAPSPAGYRFSSQVQISDMRLGLLGAVHDAFDEVPRGRARIDLVGDGASPRELARNLEGSIWLMHDSGKVDNRALDLISADLMLEVFQSLNPFAKKEDYTAIECGVYLVQFGDGIASIEAVALRTDKMTMGGRGRVNLDTEALDVSWTSKPRKGVGLSASSITNSYIKLGGTLSKPNLEVKPIEAMVTTGAAAATLGVSIVARGLWDRVTSGKDVCKAARKQVDKLGPDFAEMPPPR